MWRNELLRIGAVRVIWPVGVGVLLAGFLIAYWPSHDSERGSIPPGAVEQRETPSPKKASSDRPKTDDVNIRGEFGAASSSSMVAFVPHQPAKLFYLLDSFENENRWAPESADDHAVLSLSGEFVSEGDRSLRIDFEAFGNGKFQIRRDGPLDLSSVRTVRLDLYNAVEPMELTLSLQVNGGEGLYESPKLSIPKGWSKALRFDLEAPHFRLNGAGEEKAIPDRSRITRLALTFYELGNVAGTVHLDNLVLEYGRTPPPPSRRPVIREVTLSPQSVAVYETVEMTVDFSAWFQDFFDRSQIDVWGTFFSPSGRTIVVHGFLCEYPDERAERPAVWRIRFTPTESGRWFYDITVRNEQGEAVTSQAELICRPDPKRRGFVRVSRSDPRWFEFDNGELFYPIGLNVAWASNMAHYIKRISEQGGNLIRIWLCPWHLPLELRTEPGKYDLLVARQLDTILELAAAHGVYVQLVLEYHGMLRESWPNNPYNAANGGPCRSPEEVFTHPRARALFKRKLDYLTARWAHAPALFAWELWNEVDNGRFASFEDVVAWHREMIGHLRQVDPYGHLITTSVGGSSPRDNLLALEGISFISAHVYSPDLPDRIARSLELRGKVGKPYMIGEYSGTPHADGLAADPSGVRFHAGLWLSAMTHAAGAPLSWWWDVHIEARNLYPHLGALARFIAGEERRGVQMRFVQARLSVDKNREAAIWGLIGPADARLWIYDPEWLAFPERKPQPFITRETPLRFEGMLGGLFDVEVWDTYAGKILRRARVRSEDGCLTILLPRSAHDIAVKIKKHGPREPQIAP